MQHPLLRFNAWLPDGDPRCAVDDDEEDDLDGDDDLQELMEDMVSGKVDPSQFNLEEVLLADVEESSQEELLDVKNFCDEALAELEEANQEILRVLPLGASRLGGVPDLPDGMAWPALDGRKLPFILQLNLSELPQPNPLPAEGWLFLFALVDNEHERIPISVSVVSPNGSSIGRVDLPREPEAWPDWRGNRTYHAYPIRSGSEETDSEHGGGWVFGDIDPAFGDVSELASLENLAGDDWVNLLAVESVGTMEWSDCGHLYVLIRRSDLDRGDFGSVCGFVRS